MRRIFIGALVGAFLGAIAATPISAQAHGGRGGGGGGGGPHLSASHPTAHASTFSHSGESFHHAEAFHAVGHPGFTPGGGYGGSFAHVPGGIHTGAAPVNLHPGGFNNNPNHSNWNGNFAHNQAYFHNPNQGYRPNYYGSWYHGSWGGNHGYPWGYRPAGWGWGWGGVGFGAGLATAGLIGLASPYSWGYYNYSNPYYGGGVGAPVYANYSQPLVAAPPTYASQPVPPDGPPDGSGAPQDPTLAMFSNARDMFMQGNYQAALAQANQALAQSPNDSVMQEFRATCLFAMQDYQQSAAALYAVLSAGPGWDWTTMSGLYPNTDVYAGQLRALEDFRRQNPNAAYAHFLLAYQYMLQGHKDQATAELNAVVALQPTDQLAAQLLRGLTTQANAPDAVAAQPLAPDQQIDAAALAGNWRATRPDGAAFGLNLTPDNNFTWQFTQQGKQQVMTGSYTLANNFLILKATDQNTLLGQVAMVDPNHFTFKLAGDNPADPGLTFAR